MKKAVKCILIIIGALLAAFLILCLVLCLKDPNPSRPETISDPTGFVKAEGTNIYDGDGNLLLLKGVNLGNWFQPEHYMNIANVEGFETGVFTQQRAMDAMEANPLLTDEQIAELYDIYMTAYMSEADFANIADLGLNCVRIPFSYRNLTDEDGNLKEDAFKYLDRAIDMCEQYGLYAILDLHGAYGSQNQDFHSGDDTQLALYTSDENRAKTIALWQTLAERYKDRSSVAGYDLLNECRREYNKYGGKVNTDFYDELYQAIREIDPNHMLFIGYFTFPIHGVSPSHYGWENVCVEYHIYNNVPVSQKTCLMFYKMLHNLNCGGYPVFIGEFNAWSEESDWQDTYDYFENLGWSYASWAYKCNSWSYTYGAYSGIHGNWGIIEFCREPVNLYTAGFEEIKEAFLSMSSEYCEPSVVYTALKNR